MTVPIDQPDWQNPQTGMAVYAPIASAVPVVVGGKIGPLNLNSYNTILVSAVTTVGNGVNLNVEDADSLSSIALLTTPADNPSVSLPPTLVPVRAQNVSIVNNGADTATVTVLASSRIIDTAKRLYSPIAMDVIDLNSFAFSGTVVLGYGSGHGDGFFEFRILNSTLKGFLQVTTLAGSMLLTDTSEMHADPQSGQIIYKRWTAPGNVWRAEFVTTTGSTTSVRFRSTYDG